MGKGKKNRGEPNEKPEGLVANVKHQGTKPKTQNLQMFSATANRSFSPRYRRH